MFLYSKRSRKVIKWIWGVFAVLISLTMIVAFSGFTSLATLSSQPAVQDIPPEVLAELQAQQNGTGSPELRALLESLNASGTVDVATPTIERMQPEVEVAPSVPAEVAPRVPELNFSL